MLSVKGMYHDGQIKLEHPVPIGRSWPVVVTFLEEIAADQDQAVTSRGLDRFSFAKTREKLKNIKVCLSDAVIEERQ
ncbi:MAG: hypothetical protein H7839_10485 [Magnetococcus sp. YQC-5]